MSLVKIWTMKTAAAVLSTALITTPALANDWNIRVNNDGTACGGISIGGVRLGGCTKKGGGLNGRGSATIGNGRISVPIQTAPRKTYTINGDRYRCPVKDGKPVVPKCTPL